jgi:hypothetical protein
MLSFLVWALSGSKTNKLKLSEQVLLSLSLLAIGTWMFPQAALAQSVSASNSNFAFEINENHKIFDQVGSKKQERTQILKDYLAQKNSPLYDYADVLLDQPNWKLVLSISHAESNMCKYQRGNNCWGIGGAKYHRFYPTFAEGIVDANDLIQKYHERGLTTPRTMMYRWVGWNNQNWVLANNQVLAQLEGIGL